MAKFGEATAPLEHNQNDVSGIRRKPDMADAEYQDVREDELIEDKPLESGRRSPPPSRAQALRKAEKIKKAVDRTEDVKPLPRAKKRTFITKEGRELKPSTPESRARFEENKARDLAELERIRQENDVRDEQERRDILERLEAIEQRILETGEAADQTKAERERIEAESREEQEAVKREAMERMEASAAARDMMMEPMEGVAREMGREQAGAALAKELEGFESQLRMDGKGHVSGMKNVPYLNAHAVILALPAMWRRHDLKRTWLTKNKPPGWERLLKGLDVDAERLTQMREKADELMDAGHRDARVRNFFYRYEGQVSMEGADLTKIETFMALPEGDLEDWEKKLNEEMSTIDAVAEDVVEIDRDIDAFLKKRSKEINQSKAFVDFDEHFIAGLKQKLERLHAEHDLNHKMQRPENLDMYGKRLQAAYDRSKEMIETRKKELSMFRGDAEKRKEILGQIGEEEVDASEVQKKLAEWKEDPVRARAMGYRLEAIQREAEDLSKAIMQTENDLRGIEQNKLENEAVPEVIVRDMNDRRLGELIDFTEEKMQHLLGEKAHIFQGLDNIRRARVMQEAPPRGDEVDVDVMDAGEDDEDLDIDVDTSAFEEPEQRKAA